MIDAIDYIGFDHKASFAGVARDKGIYNLSAPVPDFGALLMVFDPEGMTIEEFCGAPMDRHEQKYFKVPHDRLFGKNRLPRNLLDFLEKKTDYISTNAGACSLNGGLLATEAALILSGKRKKEDLVVVPNVTYVDLLNRVYEVYNPMEEYFG